MYRMLERPEIGHIERTGYPSWIGEDTDNCPDEDAMFEEQREARYGTD